MIVLMNILNLKWMSILIRYWYIYLVRDGLLPSLFFVTSCHFACHFLSLLVTFCHFLSLLVTYHLFFVTSCHFLSLVSLDIYSTFYISVTLYRNWEKTALFSWRWKAFSPRHSNQASLLLCSRLGALWLIGTMCGKNKVLVFII